MSSYKVRVTKTIRSNGQEIEHVAECEFDIPNTLAAQSDNSRLIEEQNEITSKAVALFLSIQSNPKA